MNPLVDIQSGHVRLDRRTCGHRGWIILVAYALFLAFRTRYLAAGGENSPAFPVGLGDPHWLLRWIGVLVFGAVREFAYFIPIGFIAATVVSASSKRGQFSTGLIALAVGNAITALFCAVKVVGSWHLAAAVGLVFPLLGCLAGAWAGATWLRGWRARLWLLPKAVLLALLMILCASIAAWSFLDDKPLAFEAARVTSAEKRRLMHLIHDKSPEALQDDQTYTLRLTEDDVNILFSSGFPIEWLKRKAAVRLDDDYGTLLISLPVQLGAGEARYLNLRVAGSAGIEDGTLRLRVDHCRISHLRLPHWLLRSLGSFAASLLNQDRRAKPFLRAARRMTIEANSVQLTYGHLDLSATHEERRLHSSMAGKELRASAQAQVDHLLLLFAAGPLADRPPSFNLCLKMAFALARDRSRNSDAVTENRAAILALGILLGHPGIEGFLGPVVNDGSKDEARQALAQVVVHGRSDWTRHFCASAAIAILSDGTISDACGLLKEELDMEVGESGFSFADLLVDRAGTAFAFRATRDEEAARGMQDRLTRGFRVEDVCPPAGDLPEGVSEADLESRYGGVGGEEYRRLIEEIERRVAACAAYR